MKFVNQSVDKCFKPVASLQGNVDICAEVARLSRNGGDYDGTDTNNNNLVNYLIKARHDEPLEFCTLYLNLSKTSQCRKDISAVINQIINKGDNSHTRVFSVANILVTTLREIVETYDELVNGFKYDVNYSKSPDGKAVYDRRTQTLDDLLECLKPMELTQDQLDCLIWSKTIEPRVTVITTSNRQIQTEISRHRALSKNWESTRWITYNDGIKVCCPELVDDTINETDAKEFEYIKFAFANLETIYKDVLKSDVCKKYKHIPALFLPSGLKCTVGYSAFVSDWSLLNTKRTTNYCGNPHVYARALTKMIYDSVCKAIVEPEKKIKVITDSCPSDGLTELDLLRKEVEALKRENERLKLHVPTIRYTSKPGSIEAKPTTTSTDGQKTTDSQKSTDSQKPKEKTKVTRIHRSCSNCKRRNECVDSSKIKCLFADRYNWEPDEDHYYEDNKKYNSWIDVFEDLCASLNNDKDNDDD